MIIRITKTEEMIKVEAGESILEIKKDSSTWNTESINYFLIHCSSLLNEGDIMEVSKIDDDIDDVTYKHVHELFKTFVNKYNN